MQVLEKKSLKSYFISSIPKISAVMQGVTMKEQAPTKY
jgi:hypothetical protein